MGKFLSLSRGFLIFHKNLIWIDEYHVGITDLHHFTAFSRFNPFLLTFLECSARVLFKMRTYGLTKSSNSTTFLFPVRQVFLVVEGFSMFCLKLSWTMKNEFFILGNRVFTQKSELLDWNNIFCWNFNWKHSFITFFWISVTRIWPKRRFSQKVLNSIRFQMNIFMERVF